MELKLNRLFGIKKPSECMNQKSYLDAMSVLESMPMDIDKIIRIMKLSMDKYLELTEISLGRGFSNE
jgi:hypothetical protein